MVRLYFCHTISEISIQKIDLVKKPLIVGMGAGAILFAFCYSNAAIAKKYYEKPAKDVTSKVKENHLEGGKKAQDFYQMFSKGVVAGDLRLLYFDTHNLVFNKRKDPKTATFGGQIAFETAKLHGISVKLSAFAQRNFYRTDGGNRDIGKDTSTLGEAYIQWSHEWSKSERFNFRAGNQGLKKVPFASNYDYRIIPQLYQGIRASYYINNINVQAIKIFRYKSRISNSYNRTTNYNNDFDPFGTRPTTSKTDGFWAAGINAHHTLGNTALKGKAWFFNYQDYANLYYTEGYIEQNLGGISPFAALQFMHEDDSGDSYLGNIDSYMYGARVGVKHNSLEATLNFDYVPRERDAFGNGRLVTPYAHNEVSGPIFAQPYLTSTQDLGSGEAYSLQVKGSPLKDIDAGARYSYMDLVPSPLSRSIEQSEFLGYATYHFNGALKNLSLEGLFAFQMQPNRDANFWEDRLYIKYKF